MMGLLPLIPERASALADHFEALFWYITITTGAVGLGVYAALLYFCIAYRRGATGPISTPRILGSTRLELAWTVAPLMVFLTYFAWGAYVYNKAVHPPEDAEEIFIIGKQWMWKAQYPDGQRVIIGGNPANMSEDERRTITKLVVPVNRPVKFTITSEDVIHDFGIPAFRQKMDALPGRYTTMWAHPTKVGEYHIFCDQYCGTWHSLMVGKIAVVSESDYRDFLAGLKPLQGTNNPVDGSAAQRGQQLALKLRCFECHTNGADAAAPNLMGLYQQKTVRLKGGTVVPIDDAYIAESIRHPAAKVVEGWEPIMPEYDLRRVTAEQMNDLIMFIRSGWQKPTHTVQPQPPVGGQPVRPPSPGGK